MALPKFLHGDPSKHVDFIRRKRKEYEERYSESRSEKAKQKLEELFKNDAKSNKRSGE